jgi:hypothetical protein
MQSPFGLGMNPNTSVANNEEQPSDGKHARESDMSWIE